MEQLAIFQSHRSEKQEGRIQGNRSIAPHWTENLKRTKGETFGVEALLTSKEAARVLKIHPKVLERMAKRGEVPALKVGKFWRYSSTALDEWIHSRLQSTRQPCRMKTSF